MGAPLVVGCGATDVAKDVSGFDEAIQECRDAAKQIDDPQGRRTAEEACDAADSGDVGELRDAAKDQCLEAARDTRDRQARRDAVEACERID